MKTLVTALLMATTLLAAPACALQPVGDATQNNASTQTTLPAGDIAEGKRFTILVTGNPEGPDVVLIPGLATPRDVWAPTVAQLKDRYRLHIVQIRGFGDDAGINGEGPVLQPFVRELADYIDDEILNKKRPAPALIGHSMGGLTAMLIARDHPQTVSRMMIVDSLPYFGVLFGSSQSKEQIEKIVSDTRAQMRARAGQTPAPLDDTDPGGIMSITPAGRKQVARWTATANQAVAGQLFYEVATTDMRADLASIRTPLTLLYPTSPAMPAERADMLYKYSYQAKPQATMIAIPDSYHFIMLDQPERFKTEVETFLKR